MSSVVEKDDGGKGRFENEVKECQSAPLKHERGGFRDGTQESKIGKWSLTGYWSKTD